MSDDVLLCDRGEKAAREAENGAHQIDYLTDLVVRREQRELRESHILELQSLAVQGIYPCAGTYRDARTRIYIQGSQHQPPEPALVPALVREMVDRVNQESVPALQRAAYALWRLNWIHPFKGGNGRTSRAVAYQIICMQMGAMVPGTPSLPSLVLASRQTYVEALYAVDASAREADGAEPDLTPMSTYLMDLVMRQMASAVNALAKLEK